MLGQASRPSRLPTAGRWTHWDGGYWQSQGKYLGGCHCVCLSSLVHQSYHSCSPRCRHCYHSKCLQSAAGAVVACQAGLLVVSCCCPWVWRGTAWVVSD